MDKVYGVFVKTLLEMLQFLVLMIFHHLILIVEKNKFLVWGEGPTQGINDSTDAAKKKNEYISKVKTKFCSSLHYNGDESYLYVSKTEIYKFKVKDNISSYNFCLGRGSKDFTRLIYIPMNTLNAILLWLI